MNFLQCILYRNRCYQAKQYIKPTRIVVHSTGANNKTVKRYVQPHATQTDGMGGKTKQEMLNILGVNSYGNHWNRSEPAVCVNAFIGKLANGSIATVQTLPWDMRPWGCGAGNKGSFNNSAIQFEICEDNLRNKDYCQATYNEAVKLCAYLCKQYNINPDNIVSHSEAHKMGYASNHGDVEHWWSKHGLTMDGFRKAVRQALGETKPEPVQTVSIQLEVLKKGSKGEQVKTLQRLLSANGYSVGKYGIDGDFGTSTDTAVKQFQKKNGLTQDGIVGLATWNALLK